MTDFLACFILYVATFWIFGPIVLCHNSSYKHVVAGLHAVALVVIVAFGIILSVEWAIMELQR